MWHKNIPKILLDLCPCSYLQNNYPWKTKGRNYLEITCQKRCHSHAGSHTSNPNVTRLLVVGWLGGVRGRLAGQAGGRWADKASAGWGRNTSAGAGKHTASKRTRRIDDFQSPLDCQIVPTRALGGFISAAPLDSWNNLIGCWWCHVEWRDFFCCRFADSGGGVEAAYAGWRRRLAWRRRSDVSCVQPHTHFAMTSSGMTRYFAI